MLAFDRLEDRFARPSPRSEASPFKVRPLSRPKSPASVSTSSAASALSLGARVDCGGPARREPRAPGSAAATPAGLNMAYGKWKME